jgi:hypothetical protein
MVRFTLLPLYPIMYRDIVRADEIAERRGSDSSAWAAERFVESSQTIVLYTIVASLSTQLDSPLLAVYKQPLTQDCCIRLPLLSSGFGSVVA